MEKYFEKRVDEAYQSCREISEFSPDTGVILGSGLSSVMEPLQGQDIPFERIKGFPESTVKGHSGILKISEKFAVMAGRFHFYEGHSIDDVVLPVFLLQRLGVKKLVITNAAGGINSSFNPGDLVLITDQINLTALNPLTGRNNDSLGPRFPDMSEAYDKKLSGELTDLMPELKKGVYAGLKGPSYETPAEVRMLKILGADLVGMSTVNEVIAARYLDIKTAGISCVTNMAAGISPRPLDHEEVIEVGRNAGQRLAELITGFIFR